MSMTPSATWLISASGHADVRAQRELRRRAAHPDQPVAQQRRPQAELGAHHHHGAQSRRHRDLLACALPDLQQERRVAIELLAGRRQCRAGLVAHEQLAPEQLLERLHAHAHRGLRDVQPLRGAHEVAAGDDLEEGAGECDIHEENCSEGRLTFDLHKSSARPSIAPRS
jgi:hypothetical protein